MVPHKISSLLREIGLIASLATIMYLALALATYSPSDPGPTHTGSGHAIANMGGKVGAWVADLMFNAFGRAAYLFLLLLCAFMWRARQLNLQARGWSRALPGAGLMCAMLGACGLEWMYFPTQDALSVLTAGGIIGQSSATKLLVNFGSVGATVIFIVLFITGVTLAAYVSWFQVMDRIGYRVFALLERFKSQLEKQNDHQVGVQVRKRRQVSVNQFRAELSARKPPKIAPKIEPTPPSQRRLSEQQKKIFPDDPAAADLPPLSLLEAPAASMAGYSRDALAAMSQLLVKKLKDFNVDVVVDAVQPGPVITRFELDPAPGVKASQIVGLARDLARSLSVESVRVVDNIAGKTVVGLEIPNQSREIVRLVEGLSSPDYDGSASPLSLVLGKDIAGGAVITDLMKMPHVLIAGTTGSGKSVCVNALILSLLYKATPQQVRLIMVDPKFLELSAYDGIPHLLTPVVTDMTKAACALRWCIGEMDRRFRVMAAIGVRNIIGYNKKVVAAAAGGAPLADPILGDGGGDGGSGGEADGGDGMDAEHTPRLQELPFIVVVVDELADLMMVVGKKIEEIIIRIAQRARAAGIHLVLATQRPSVDVVTGLIKANVPTRIAFQVSSRVDSRTVLDQMGAEQLLGQGDMLFLPPGTGLTMRVHGSFVSDEEVAAVVAHLKSSGAPNYVAQVIAGDGGDGGSGGGSGGEAGGDGEADELYDEAVRFVTQSRRASISSLQRVLRVGYNRAARMIETMEESGVVGPAENGKREVLAAKPPQQ